MLRRLARIWVESSVLEGELGVAGGAFGSLCDGIIVRVQGWRHALQLEPYTSTTRPRAILQGAIATYLAFTTAVAGAHDLEALVSVVFVDEDILFGVGSSGGSGLSHDDKVRPSARSTG